MMALGRLRNEEGDFGSPDHFRWKLFQVPCGPALITLCKDTSRDGLIVAQCGIIPRQVKVGDQTLLVGLRTDLLVHPEYRRQGLGTMVIRASNAQSKAAGMAFAYSVPNPASYSVVTKKITMITVGKVPLLLKPIDLRGLSSRLGGMPLAGTLLSLLQAVFARIARTKRAFRHASTLAVRRVEHFDGTFDDFWSRIENKRPVMIKRSSEYLEWRFGAVPRRNYHTWAAVEDGQVRGNVVTRIMDVQRTLCGMIADFVVEDSAAGLEAGELLISTVQDHFQKAQVALSGCLMLRGTNEFKLLRRRGYFVCPPRFEPQPFPLALYPLKASASQSPAQDIGNWFLTMGDYDVV
jgi:GNAT superfamily N-acetyltransferase